jgi:predicted RNase H-like HicB family nuclease
MAIKTFQERLPPSMPRCNLASIVEAQDHGMIKIEIEREEDGRWIGEVPSLPGVVVYAATEAEARTKAIALALRVIADRIEHGEPVPAEARNLFAAA